MSKSMQFPFLLRSHTIWYRNRNGKISDCFLPSAEPFLFLSLFFVFEVLQVRSLWLGSVTTIPNNIQNSKMGFWKGKTVIYVHTILRWLHWLLSLVAVSNVLSRLWADVCSLQIQFKNSYSHIQMIAVCNLITRAYKFYNTLYVIVMPLHSHMKIRNGKWTLQLNMDQAINNRPKRSFVCQKTISSNSKSNNNLAFETCHWMDDDIEW